MLPRPISIALAAALATSFLGCASFTDQRNLKPIQTGETLVIEREFRYDISKEIDLPRPKPGMFRGLLAGTYLARYEDAEGIYFANDDLCVIVEANLERRVKFVVPGGVWISKSPRDPAFRLYRIAHSDARAIPIDQEPACGSVRADKPAGNQTTTSNSSSLVIIGIEAMIDAERGKIQSIQAPAAGTAVPGIRRMPAK